MDMLEDLETSGASFWFIILLFLRVLGSRRAVREVVRYVGACSYTKLGSWLPRGNCLLGGAPSWQAVERWEYLENQNQGEDRLRGIT
ncbi:hypothetical protein BKA67DRAFT_239345 [Truncatella angustata]|uniref:Uncharacterized protein n=1 Tax=Truncatella angustata TaxID=152316 RepID=A0A9P8ZZY7_9PEZI|nr:uncharacterized protein BKA67DRAFT_239345 [Truncatella angustata]KAH6655494.1 hypothetical protein BKA67DRAFT_239345 [Truncatella angustata]